MSNKFNHFLAKAAALTAEAEAYHANATAILNAIAVLAANDDDEPEGGPPAVPKIAEFAHEVEVAAVGHPVEIVAASNVADALYADYLAVLTHEFQKEGAIYDALKAAGVKTSVGTVHNRMRDLGAHYPHMVEGETGPLRWRLKGKAPAPVVKMAAATKAAVKAKKLSTADVAPVSFPKPANDIAEPLKLGLHHGDCLKLMKAIPDQSVDLVLCDPPFGTCGAKSPKGTPIDANLDLEALWAEYRRIIKPNGNIVLFGSQPFSTDLINAGREFYKYTNIWRKDKGTGFDHARNKPLKDYEDVLVFSPANVAHARKPGKRASGTTLLRATFNPWKAKEVVKRNNPLRTARARYAPNIKAYEGHHTYLGLENCPRMVMDYAKEPNGFHPYQKPQALLDDLIRTYSNPGEVVLDNCVGGGSTAIAAINAGREWIAIEQDDHYHGVAKARIDAAIAKLAA